LLECGVAPVVFSLPGRIISAKAAKTTAASTAVGAGSTTDRAQDAPASLFLLCVAEENVFHAERVVFLKDATPITFIKLGLFATTLGSCGGGHGVNPCESSAGRCPQNVFLFGQQDQASARRGLLMIN
jgi:hypothetical protein